MTSLKQFVEQLDSSSVPRFLAQVSESRETGGSRSYAISLYEEVARVHGKLIIPHIPRVITTVTKSLSASGSSPQMHQACAKVVTAMARYSVDPETPAALAEEILRDISQPIVEMIAGKLEPVAAGAAACMQALVESEKWKYASDVLVNDVCHQTAVALGEKSTRTVEHMQLARSLATMNPVTLNTYGKTLLRAGGEILQFYATSWQHRKCAAKMLQAVLSIVDRDTLASELSPTMQVLGTCRHDRMPHVRIAVCEALQAAKKLATDEPKRDTTGSASLAASAAVSNAAEGCKPTPHQRSLWSSDESSLSPSKLISPVSLDSHHLSSSSASTTTTTDSINAAQVPSACLRGNVAAGKVRRAPLFPSRGHTHLHRLTPLSTSPSSSTDECGSLAHGSDAKENVPSQNLANNRIDQSAAGTPENQGVVRSEKESTPAVSISQEYSKGRFVSHLSPLEASIMRKFVEAEGDLLAEDEDILLRVPTADIGMEEDFCCRSGRSGTELVVPQLSLGSTRSESSESVVHSLRTATGGDSEGSIRNNCSRSNGSGHENASYMKKSCVNCANGMMKRKVAKGGSVANKSAVNGLSDFPRIGVKGNAWMGDFKGGSPNSLATSHSHSKSFTHLPNNTEEAFGTQTCRLLLTTEDFLPFTTPRRLVRSLQSDISSPDSKGMVVDQERKIGEDGEVMAGDITDMDLDTSSEAGWSVRDNPIASDESFGTQDSSEDEPDQTPRGLFEAFASPQNVPAADGVSPCESRAAASVPQKVCSVGSDMDLARTPEAVCRSSRGGDIGTYRLTPRSLISSGGSVVTGPTCSSCIEHQKPMLKRQEWQLCTGVTGLEADEKKSSQSSVARRRSLFSPFLGGEPRGVGECCSCSHGSDGSMTGWTVDELKRESQRGSKGTREAQLDTESQYAVVRLVKRNWGQMCCYLELILGGSLCVILAIPLAMVVARTLGAPREHSLVPT